jgi:hypothetical protein
MESEKSSKFKTPESTLSQQLDKLFADWHFGHSLPAGTPASVSRNLKVSPFKRALGPQTALSPNLNEFEKREFRRILRRTKKRYFKKRAEEGAKKRKVDLNRLAEMDILGPDDPFIKSLEGALNQDLKMKGLYSEEGQEVAFSEVFPVAQSKKDPESTLSPEKRIEIDSLLGYITNERNELGEITTSETPDLPVLTTPQIHNMMRRNPASIFEKVARLTVETGYFANFPEQNYFLPCAYFFSKGINDELVFYFVKRDLFRLGRLQLLKDEFYFTSYLEEQEQLKKVISILLKDFFRTPWVKKATKKIPHG